PPPEHRDLARSAPRVEARRLAGQLALDYRLPRQAAAAPPLDRLVVTVNSPDDELPPKTVRVLIDPGARRATATTRIELDPEKRYEFRVSAAGPRGGTQAASSMLRSASH